MKVICAPNAFKECLSASDAARAMAAGVRAAVPGAHADLCPVADGGDGTLQALIDAAAGEYRFTEVLDPLGRPRPARWGLLGRQSRFAVVEMAAASGLALLAPAQRDPARTTTFGTGQLIAAALNSGAREIVLGIGGSATCDGGAGCLQALGVRFFRSSGQELTRPLAGGDLAYISRIDLSQILPAVRDTRLTIACDVTNPLTGPTGAAAVYAPQKGATPQQVQELERGLQHWAELLRRDAGIDVENLPGAGAAGGLGAGLVACAGAQLSPGVDLVLRVLDFDRRVADCALCLTGEGRLDAQTLAGKACLGVARAAARHGVPTVALVGQLHDAAAQLLRPLFQDILVIGPGLPHDQSIRRAPDLLAQAAAKVVTEACQRQQR